jgi:hypothetical protein
MADRDPHRIAIITKKSRHLFCRVGTTDNPHNNGPLTAQITARDEKGRFVGDHDLSGDLRPA